MQSRVDRIGTKRESDALNPTRVDRARTDASPALAVSFFCDRIAGRVLTPINSARSCCTSLPLPFRAEKIWREHGPSHCFPDMAPSVRFTDQGGYLAPGHGRFQAWWA